MSENRLKLNTDKTDLLWVGPRYHTWAHLFRGEVLTTMRYTNWRNYLYLYLYSLHQHDLCLPELHLGHDSVVARDHVRLLEATISSDLSLDRHVSVVSASGFYWLRQLRRCRRSLDTQSAATLVHSFVSSRVDYCNALLAGAPKVTTDKLQRVLNAAARVITGTHKFDRGISRLLHTELHWLNVPERVTYLLCIMVHSCLQGQAPQYLVKVDLCQPVSDVASRQLIRSASRRLLVLPRDRLQTYGWRAFSVSGPSAWNSLPDNLRDPSVTRDSFRRLSKKLLYALYWSIQRIKGFTKMRYTNLLVLLTYLQCCPPSDCWRLRVGVTADFIHLTLTNLCITIYYYVLLYSNRRVAQWIREVICRNILSNSSLY